MNEFILYQKYLGTIPEFLNKYLELGIMKRLEDISLLCGMEYASPYAYDFKFSISRYNHSLNVALITWKLTHCKTQTLAALFHDISSPTFSHVVDYMNKDYDLQESTEDKTEEVLLSEPILLDYLQKDEIDFKSIINFKDYSIVDSKRPCMCADRLDNIISVGMNWYGKVDHILAELIIDNMTLYRNELNKLEIGFKDANIANYVKEVNDIINEYTHTNEDTYMMILLANILKICININLFSYDDLYYLRESEIVEIIEENSVCDVELDKLWLQFKTIKNIPLIKKPAIKNKIVDPLVKGYRLSKY